GVVHAVAAADVAAREGRDVQSAAQDLPRDLERQDVAGPGEQVHRDEGAAADRVDVRQRVGRGDAAPVVGVVDDRGEEVGGGDGGQAARGAGDADDGGVVAGVEADDQLAVRGRGCRGQARDDVLQLAGRDLAGAAPAVRVPGQPPGPGAGRGPGRAFLCRAALGRAA